MDTNWKKSKLALRILCGWLAVFFLLGAAGLTCLVTPKQLLAGSADGMADLLAGEVSGSVDYQERMAYLFYNSLLWAAGGQDPGGRQFTAAQSAQLRTQAGANLRNALSQYQSAGSDLLLCIAKGGEVLACTPEALLYDEGQVAPPLGYSVALAVQGGQMWGNRALLHAYSAYRARQEALPSSAGLQDCVVVLAVRDAPQQAFGFIANAVSHIETVRLALITILCCMAGALVFGLVCLCQYKRGRAARCWAARLMGKLPLEVKLLLWFAALGACAAAWALWFWWRQTLFLACCAAFFWPLFWLTAVDLSHNKGNVFRHSLAAKGVGTLRMALRGLPWQRRVLGSAGACWLGALALTAGAPQFRFPGWGTRSRLVFLLFAFTLAAAMTLEGLWLLTRWLRDTARLTGKIAELRAGADTPPLALAPTSPLAGAAADLNALEEGIARAVEERGRADRMKVELITNVSHDLKTPLTSIINYSDLLCAEPLEGAAADYAKVIRQKAERLKSMVQDVFDLSKATSGNLPLAPKVIDLAKLVRQTLADMDEAIAASPLTFRTELPAEAWVQADGDRLYRVFQNLFTNALQYSLPGSRVYVELACEGGRAVASVKNVARYEMEFDPAQITERFVRGDASRTGEGSGLGLSIAKSFTEACGGSFSVRAEADLFCAEVALDLTEIPAESRQEAPPPQTAPAAGQAAGAGAL